MTKVSHVYAEITKGTYRGKTVAGRFQLVKGYVDGARGGYITIENPSHVEGTPSCQRVQLKAENFKLVLEDGSDLPAHTVLPGSDAAEAATAGVDWMAKFMETETEDEAMERIARTFGLQDKLVDSCAKGIIRGMVISGPPGIGKSFGVERQLATANMFLTVKGINPNYETISGGVSAIGLYQKLYNNRAKEKVVVFDDCDGVLFEEECLNLLKAALNSGDKRQICWNKESRILETDDIPQKFDFEGSIIFLSNIDFDRSIAKQSRIASHLEAIMSRCHYMDLEIGSVRDKILRIKQIVRDGMLKPYGFTKKQDQEIVDFVQANAEYLREISLRMVKKIADFVKSDPKEWYELAEATCLTRDAKFKRLALKKAAVPE